MRKINCNLKKNKNLKVCKRKTKEHTYLVRVEEASGMDTLPRKYKVRAINKDNAMYKAMLKEGNTPKEARELMKERDDELGGGYPGTVFGGDVVYMEADKI